MEHTAQPAPEKRTETEASDEYLYQQSRSKVPRTDKEPTTTEPMRPPVGRFGIHPLKKYRLPCPQFTEPKELLSFSYSDRREICMDNRELKYYYPPQIDPLPHLFDGFEMQIKRDSMINEHIDGLLTSLCNVQKNSADQQPFQADFVMYRGMLTRIFTTPYSLRDSWSMNATKIGSTIYIEEDVTPEKIAERNGSSDWHRKLMYSGYRFESLCVVSKPPDELVREELDKELQSRSNAVVNTNSEYCSVFRTRLGAHSIISGAEVDCIDGKKPAELPNRLYRELKTSSVLDTQRKKESFERHKLLKFWAQSFIAGIPTVTVGYRDNEGILRSVEDIKTQDMPRRVRGQPGMWEANVCMNFADMLLQFFKDVVVNQGPDFQYRIKYDAEAQEVQVLPLGKCKPFLTQEYIAMIEK